MVRGLFVAIALCVLTIAGCGSTYRVHGDGVIEVNTRGKPLPQIDNLTTELISQSTGQPVRIHSQSGTTWTEGGPSGEHKASRALTELRREDGVRYQMEWICIKGRPAVLTLSVDGQSAMQDQLDLCNAVTAALHQRGLRAE